MKKTYFFYFLLGTSSHVYAETRSCQEQLFNVKAKLSTAQAVNNSYAERRLKRALSDIEVYCNDTNQRQRAIKIVELKKLKLHKAEIELQAEKNALQDANERGSNSMILHKMRRVKRKEIRLEEAKDELNQAQSDLSKLEKIPFTLSPLS